MLTHPAHTSVDAERTPSAGDSDPFEYLPGAFDRSGVIDWRFQAPRPDASALARTAGAAEDPLDTTSGLAPYTGALDTEATRHLLRRTGFSASPDLVAEFSTMTAQQAADVLVDGALALGADPAPDWIDDAPTVPARNLDPETFDAYWAENWNRYYARHDDLYLRALNSPELTPQQDAARGLRDRLSLMWHNHYVTSMQSYRLMPWLVRYWRLIEDHCLGNVQTLTDEMGRQPAMLVYLNGIENRAGAPNENYARELMELFTMGIFGPDGTANYTQQDIAEIARALTGWGADAYGVSDTPLESRFVPQWHDDGVKTFFGQTGAWGYDDVIQILFEQRSSQIAWWIASRLYREFVYDIPHPGVVQEMATQLLTGGWEIAPVVRRLIASEHFYDQAARRAKVRSPFEHHIAAYREIGAPANPAFMRRIYNTMKLAGQEVFRPPTVAGWDGGLAWLDTNRLTFRWQFQDNVILQQPSYRALAQTTTDPFDPVRLVADLAQRLCGISLSDAEAEALAPILLNGIPAYEWNPEVGGAEARIRGLVQHLLRLPEFQLV